MKVSLDLSPEQVRALQSWFSLIEQFVGNELKGLSPRSVDAVPFVVLLCEPPRLSAEHFHTHLLYCPNRRLFGYPFDASAANQVHGHALPDDTSLGWVVKDCARI